MLRGDESVQEHKDLAAELIASQTKNDGFSGEEDAEVSEDDEEGPAADNSNAQDEVAAMKSQLDAAGAYNRGLQSNLRDMTQQKGVLLHAVGIMRQWGRAHGVDVDAVVKDGIDAHWQHKFLVQQGQAKAGPFDPFMANHVGSIAGFGSETGQHQKQGTFDYHSLDNRNIRSGAGPTGSYGLGLGQPTQQQPHVSQKLVDYRSPNFDYRSLNVNNITSGNDTNSGSNVTSGNDANSGNNTNSGSNANSGNNANSGGNINADSNTNPGNNGTSGVSDFKDITNPKVEQQGLTASQNIPTDLPGSHVNMEGPQQLQSQPSVAPTGKRTHTDAFGNAGNNTNSKRLATRDNEEPISTNTPTERPLNANRNTVVPHESQAIQGRTPNQNQPPNQGQPPNQSQRPSQSRPPNQSQAPNQNQPSNQRPNLLNAPPQTPPPKTPPAQQARTTPTLTVQQTNTYNTWNLADSTQNIGGPMNGQSVSPTLSEIHHLNVLAARIANGETTFERIWEEAFPGGFKFPKGFGSGD